MALKIRGIAQTTNIKLDTAGLYIDIERLRSFLGVRKDEATQIAVRTDSATLLKELQSSYKNLDVKSFLELYPMLKQMEEIMVIFNSITFFIVMLVVFIGILGVMHVSILDRIRGFGIMCAVGMSYRHIRLQISLKALFVGLVGYTVGALLGYAALLYLQRFCFERYFAAEENQNIKPGRGDKGRYMIRLENVQKYFYRGESREVHALKNISLMIEKGEFTLFHGPSDCGKTTAPCSMA